MKLLTMDPSGNFGKEGQGTTGVCIMIDGEVTDLFTISAKDYKSEIEYWEAHADLIEKEWPDHFCCEGYKLYNHKGMAAKTQANSELQTSQLIGVLKLTCHRMNIPYNVQFASDVKSRWQEAILVHLGYLEAKGGKWYFKGKSTLPHHRDALKHALHFDRYKKEKL